MKKLVVAFMVGTVLLTNVMQVSAAGVRDVFDAKYYASQYKDLQAAFGNDEEALYQHFMEYGLKEGRNMNPILDIANYRKQYQDLDKAFGDNWDAYVEHYFAHGIKENRNNGTDFDVRKYQAAYEDIQESFGDDYEKVARHFIEFGQNEDRIKGNKSYEEPKPVAVLPEDIEDTEDVEDTENENETEQTPIELVADFNEDFNIGVGEKLYVGSEDICIEISEFSENEHLQYYEYTLYIKGEAYKGSIILWADDEQINISQEKFSVHRVRCSKTNGKDGVTLQISDVKEVKKPLILSGNESDEIVTTQPEYMVGDNFILYVDEGTKLYGNTMEWLDMVLTLTEKETGMTMPDRKGIYQGTISYLYDREVFEGVDPEGEKFSIYVVPGEKSSPCGGADYIILNPIDLENKQGEGFAIVHEYTHALQANNGGWLSSILDEGWTTYISGEICRKDEVYVFDFDAEFNYSNYKQKITKENAEKIFITEPEDGWQDYLYGYRLMNFLMEKYGKKLYLEMLADKAANGPTDRDYLTREEAAELLKKHTSSDVFELFADWLEENRERFGDE